MSYRIGSIQGLYVCSLPVLDVEKVGSTAAKRPTRSALIASLGIQYCETKLFFSANVCAYTDYKDINSRQIDN